MTEKQQALLDCLFDKDVKGDLRLAMRKAGYADSTPMREVLNSSIGDKIEMVVREYIARVAAKAAFSMGDILDDPVALGNKNKMVAAKDILDRAGFNKTDKVEVTAESPIFILPPKE